MQPRVSKKRKTSARRSWVWEYFVFDESESVAKCSICLKNIEYYGSSTTELIRHLRDKHKIDKTSPTDLIQNSRPDNYNLSDEEYNDQFDFVDMNKKHSKISERQKQILDDLLMAFLIDNNLPFNLVDSKTFRELVNKLNGSYQMPCRETLRKNILPKMVKYISRSLNFNVIR